MNASRHFRGERGAAIAELALLLPFILLLLFLTIDFGHVVQSRLIITNLSREGASIASRSATIDSDITKMLMASGNPLDMNGPDVRVYVTRIAAGVSRRSTRPKIETQLKDGKLNVASKITSSSSTLGLTQRVYDHLVFRRSNDSADIPEVTVVEVFYKYRPITPLPKLAPGLLDANGGGIILTSKAVF